MRNPSKTAAIWAGTSALSLLLSMSAFADSRPQNESWRNDRHSRDTAQVRQSSDGNHQERAGRVERDQSRNGSYDRGRTEAAQRPAVAEPQRDLRESRDAAQQAQRESQYRNGRNDNGNRNESRSAEGQYRNDSRRNDGQYRNDSRGNGGQYRNDSRGRVDTYRNGRGNDGRINELGRIRSFQRERDGYRIYLDHGNYSYWIPESRLRGRRLSVGLSLRLGGIFRGGLIDVDVLGWPGDPYYNDPYSYDPYYSGAGYGYGDDVLRGVVERVDYRTGTLLLRDGYRGGLTTVDMRSVDRRYSRLDTADLRPGDRVTLVGSWLRGGYFGAVKIDAIDAY